MASFLSATGSIITSTLGMQLDQTSYCIVRIGRLTPESAFAKMKLHAR